MFDDCSLVRHTDVSLKTLVSLQLNIFVFAGLAAMLACLAADLRRDVDSKAPRPAVAAAAPFALLGEDEMASAGALRGTVRLA